MKIFAIFEGHRRTEGQVVQEDDQRAFQSERFARFFSY